MAAYACGSGDVRSVLSLAVYGVGVIKIGTLVTGFLLGLPIGLWLSNLLHECAHMMAYLCLRLGFRRIRVGHLLYCAGEGFRFDAKSKLFAAECVCGYDKTVAFWKYCIALLSGGLACAIVSPFAIWAALPLEGAADAFLLCFGAASALNAAINLLYPRSSDRTILRKIRNDQLAMR